MQPNFNINRPKISDEEINQHKDFDSLVKQFKEQSLKKARGDESWWRNKKIQYSTLIAGITVVCTITYSSIVNSTKQTTKSNDKITTQKKDIKPPSKKSQFIKAPSAKLAINYTTYKIDNAKDVTIQHPGGTKINLPKKIFVTKNGEDIQGEVSIEYREFQDIGDVIVSGIPMTYDSAGKTYNFESAGMFDIKGHQNGEPVYLKPGKTLNVQLASSSKETKFNQYYLDTLKQNWQYLKHDEVLSVSKTKYKAAQATNVPFNENKKTEILQKQINTLTTQEMQRK